MADEPVTDPVEEVVTPDPDPAPVETPDTAQDRDWKALRAQADEAEGLRGQLRDNVFLQVPFDRDPEGNLTGIGKAVSKEYEGDLTPEAILTYADSEYGWTPPETPTAAGELTQQMSRLAQVGGSSEPVVTPRNYREAVDEKEKANPNGEIDRDLITLKSEWAAAQSVQHSAPDL